MLKLIVILILVWVTGTVVLGLCEAASRADRWEEKWIEQRKKEEAFKGWKWCEDECYRCPESDWCKFSEVKKE
jgi:hypothetical protein